MKNTYICFRCNINTNRKSILKNHLEKKNKCKKLLNNYFIPNNILIEMSKIPLNNDDNDFKCKYCLKDYSCKYNLERHTKICYKDKKNQNILSKYKIFSNFEIKKYINDFNNLTLLKYFDKNKIYTSFFKSWNLNHIDNLTKKLLYMTTDKFSDLLRKILENDKNINIIFDLNESYGYILNNDNEIEIINKKEIIYETMKKILETYESFKFTLENDDKLLDQSILDKEYNIIKDKYDSYLNNENIYKKVEYIILNIYSDKFFEIQNYAFFELNNKNIGF